jgi:hypothetical protein
METRSEQILVMGLLYMDLEQVLLIASIDPQLMAILLMIPEKMWTVLVS